MTSGIYPRTEEHKLNMKIANTGKKRSETAKLNYKNSKIGNKNPQWKGDDVGYNAIHSWVKRHKPKPLFCEECNKRKPYDVANISGKYKRDINDFRWLCRSCHMKTDGRLKKLRINYKPKQKGIQIKMRCLNCSKEFYVTPYLSEYRKNCSKKCMGEYRSKNKLFWGNQYVKNT